MTAALLLAVGLWLPAGAWAERGSPRSARSWRRSGPGVGRQFDAPALSGYTRDFEFSRIDCVTRPSKAKNVTLDCPNEYAFPTREPTIAVDPTDPFHMVNTAIDGDFVDQAIGFSTTFDGGKTWTIGDIPHPPNLSNFDPWVTFDVKHGVVILSYQSIAPIEPNYCPPSGAQFVTISTDGGLTWGDPVTVQKHRGCTGNTLWLYEAKTSADNNPSSHYYGRTWLTGGWIGCKNGDCTYPTAETHSDDGGSTWTKPVLISGSNAQFCTASPHPPQCDNNFPPMLPVISPDGSVFVAFVDESHGAAWEPGECCEDQLMVVRSTDGGDTWSPPVHIADLENGGDFKNRLLGDYDCSEGHYGCRMTGINLLPFYSMSNLALSPNGTMYLAFSDNRNGRHDVPHPVSNSDVFLMTSTDQGQTWTGPDVASNAPGDQFKPALAVNPLTGKLGILFYDRGADPVGKTMNGTLATGLPGHFHLETITTAPSQLSGDLWLAETLTDCVRCVYHVGEYMGLAYGSDGTVHMTWADLRRFVKLPDGRTGYTMNVDYARRRGDHR